MVKNINIMFTIKNNGRACPVETTLKGTPSVSHFIYWALRYGKKEVAVLLWKQSYADVLHSVEGLRK